MVRNIMYIAIVLTNIVSPKRPDIHITHHISDGSVSTTRMKCDKTTSNVITQDQKLA